MKGAFYLQPKSAARSRCRSCVRGLSGLEPASAGTARDAEEIVSADLITWADTIFVMEAVHHRRLKGMFPSLMRDKRVIVLGIPDEYPFMDAKLIELLRQKVETHLR